MLIRELTKEIGKILQFSFRYEQSRKVYMTIRFVSKVIELFQEQIEKEPQNIALRIDLAEYASNHLREADAIRTLQEAYELAQDYKTLNKVK